MKYAIVLRGISYAEDFKNETHLDTWTVDFDKLSQLHKMFLFEPLREKGHQVDIFFNTYGSVKLESYVNEFKPVDVKLGEFNRSFPKGHSPLQHHLIVTSLEQVKEYQEKNNIEYDFVIVTRFDIAFFSDFSKCLTVEDGISVPTINDPAFMVYHKNVLDKSIGVIRKYFGQMIDHHLVYAFMREGIRCHSMWPNKPGNEVGFNGPLWRLSASCIQPDGHNAKEFNFFEIFDKTSNRFGFLYEPNKEFFSCSWFTEPL